MFLKTDFVSIRINEQIKNISLFCYFDISGRFECWRDGRTVWRCFNGSQHHLECTDGILCASKWYKLVDLTSRLNSFEALVNRMNKLNSLQPKMNSNYPWLFPFNVSQFFCCLWHVETTHWPLHTKWWMKAGENFPFDEIWCGRPWRVRPPSTAHTPHQSFLRINLFSFWLLLLPMPHHRHRSAPLVLHIQT